MSYNDLDYQKLADAIVKDFISEKLPLESSTIKVANDMGMNVHETRRLVEATNTAAHLSLFSKMAEHKYVEFDIVDPQVVCDSLFSSPKSISDDTSIAGIDKVASSNHRDIPDERWESIRERVEKVASAALGGLEIGEPEFPKYSTERAYHAIKHVNQVRDELHNTLLTDYQHYQDKIAELKLSGSYIYNRPVEELVKEAYALHPEHLVDAIVIDTLGSDETLLNNLRSSKVAFVDDSTPQHALVKEVVSARQRLVKTAQAVEHIEKTASGAFIT